MLENSSTLILESVQNKGIWENVYQLHDGVTIYLDKELFFLVLVFSFFRL